MTKNKIILTGLLITSLLSGCAATSLQPNAQRVEITPNPPAKNCKYIGQVQGDQGNFFTGPWTSNKNLQQGAMNDIRNKAAAMHANYVQLLNSNTAQHGGAYQGSGSVQEVGVQVLGNAYYCPGQR